MPWEIAAHGGIVPPGHGGVYLALLSGREQRHLETHWAGTDRAGGEPIICTVVLPAPPGFRGKSVACVRMVDAGAIRSVTSSMMMNGRRLAALLLAGCALAQLGRVRSGGRSPVAGEPAAGAAGIRAAFAQLPLSFEPSVSRGAHSRHFVTRGPGYRLTLAPTEAVLSVCAVKPATPHSAVRGMDDGRAAQRLYARHPRALRAGRVPNLRADSEPPRPARNLHIRLVGANGAAQANAEAPLPGRSNYLLGHDPSKWRTDVPTYSRVRYTGVYSGIDLVYYGHHGELEYDFRVAAGADPSAIAFRFGDGETPPTVDAGGDLVARTSEGEFRQHRPILYQEVEGRRSPVEGSFVVASDGLVGFQVGAYDTSRTLVIDPTLAYSTFLGSDGDDVAWSIAADASGNLYITGNTSSAGFPTTPGSYKPTNPEPGGLYSHVFVAKLNPAGSQLIYSTYVGGDKDDYGNGIAIDNQGNAYVAGATRSGKKFPTTTGAYKTQPEPQRPAGSWTDAFVLKLNAQGSALVYSTLLGGRLTNVARAIGVDVQGYACVTGYTGSWDFPVVNAFQGGPASDYDSFVVRLNPQGTGVAYSTFLGGSDIDSAFALTVDVTGNAYLAGETYSHDFPTVAQYQGQNNSLFGGTDGFISIVAPTGALLYSTYLGGDDDDTIGAIALSPNGTICVTGSTFSTTFPTTAGALNRNPPASDEEDAFVTRFDPSRLSLSFSTYLGGNDNDGGYGIAVDSVGNIYVSGTTESTNFPTKSAIQATHAGRGDSLLGDGFITKLASTGNSLVYSTFLGGGGDDVALGIAVPTTGVAYVSGFTTSLNFPKTSGAFHTSNGGGQDGFLAKITDVGNAPGTPTNLKTTSVTGNEIRLAWTRSGTTETGFEVWQKVGTGAYAQLDTVNAGVVTYISAGLTPNTKYSYQVRAFNASGVSAFSNEVVATTPQPPLAPTQLRLTPVSGTEIDLSWTRTGSNEKGFEVQRKTNTTSYVQAASVAAGVVTFQDKVLAPNVTYTYRVRAFNDSGQSDWSTEQSATTPNQQIGQLSVSSATLAFGTVKKKKSKVLTVTVKNLGTGALTATVGKPAKPYAVTVGGGSFSLTSGASRAVTVQFKPTKAGVAKGTLTITSPDSSPGSVSVSLTGKGK